MNVFRLADNMRYRLMPYIYAQAKQCTEKGLPMLRALLIEYPDDPGSWLIDNEYLFGSDMLVAPLFENTPEREVYLPPATWIDYQTGKSYHGGWHSIAPGEIPIIILVKEGSVIPHIKLAQSTMQMDWTNLELIVYATEQTQSATGEVCLPEDNIPYKLLLKRTANSFNLENDPFQKEIKWTIRTFTGK